MFRIGHSHDIHRLGDNRKLILGGIEIPYEYGLIGHSDADVVLHVVAESIIGALGLGDLGTFFPDTDLKYKNVSSDIFVRRANQMAKDAGYRVNNMDITVFLEKPHLQIYKQEIKNNIALLLGVDPGKINIKATRGEGLGYIGRMEGISATAVVLLASNPIMKKL
jgi:2-C-methyl-D-erythritol 2,4-cyclodiphosphate synthase